MEVAERVRSLGVSNCGAVENDSRALVTEGQTVT